MQRTKIDTDDALVLSIRNGNLDAKRQLWEDIGPTFNWLVKRVHTRFPNIDKEDLQQEIYLMFESCIKYFIPEKGTFRMYFRQTVLNNAMQMYLANQIVRIPATCLTYYSEVKTGKSVPKSVKKIDELSRARAVPTEEIIKTADWETPPKNARLHETQSIIRDALRFLPERYRHLLERYYGIGTFPMIMDQIAQQDGISRQRVEQVKKKRLNSYGEYYCAFIRSQTYNNGGQYNAI